MRVLQIVADGTPGGGTTNVLSLTEDLLSTGIEVGFCSEAASPAIESALRLGAETIDGIRFFRSRIDRDVVRKLQHAAASFDPDLVHCHGARAALAWIRGASPRQKRRTLYTVRGYQFRRKSRFNRMLAMQAERWISRAVFRTVHVAQSDQDEAVADRLITSREQSLVIRNGIRLSDFAGLVDVAPGCRQRVAVLGRITEPKNPMLVLDLAQRLAGEGFEFHLIGGGDLESAVRQRVARERLTNVIMHGTQSRSSGLRLMSQCGTFLLASIWEGLPLAPVEAMAMGLAVVISDVNGCTEVVRNGIDGRVAPSENRDAFAEALRAVVADPESTQRMIASGKERVAQAFTTDRVLAQHLELYRSCLASE